MCTGDVISWLGSDDLYTPGTLFKINELFSTLPPSVGVIHGNSEIFNSNQIIRLDKGYEVWSIARQLAGMTFPQPSSFIRKSALDQSGKLNPSFHYGMDYDLFSRLIMVSDFQYIDIQFSKYRLHDESKSTIAIAKFIEEWIIIFNSIAVGLKLEETIQVLEKNNLKTNTDTATLHFFSELKSIKKIDYEKMLFYFLVNVIRYDYVSENFNRVRKIGKYVSNEFGDYLKSEPLIKKVIRRTQLFPSFLIKIARTTKRLLLK